MHEALSYWSSTFEEVSVEAIAEYVALMFLSEPNVRGMSFGSAALSLSFPDFSFPDFSLPSFFLSFFLLFSSALSSSERSFLLFLSLSFLLFLSFFFLSSSSSLSLLSSFPFLLFLSFLPLTSSKSFPFPPAPPVGVLARESKKKGVGSTKALLRLC